MNEATSVLLDKQQGIALVKRQGKWYLQQMNNTPRGTRYIGPVSIEFTQRMLGEMIHQQCVSHEQLEKRIGALENIIKRNRKVRGDA